MAAIAQHIGKLVPQPLYEEPYDELALDALNPRHEVAGLVSNPVGILHVAILPSSCRQAGQNSLWHGLCQTGDQCDTIPEWRYDWDLLFRDLYVKGGCFVNDAECFDYQTFGITLTESWTTDPAHRLLLEDSWSALVRSGFTKSDLAASPTGVFVGISGVGEWAQVMLTHGKSDAVFAMHGKDGGAAAGRLSYLFGLKGPCFSLSTACSSSLVALDAACQNVKLDVCDTSLVASVNLLLHATTWSSLCALHALAPNGSCKTFDQLADGYGRGEGCGAFMITAASSKIHLVRTRLAGCSVNQDGRSASFMAPNGPSQEAVIMSTVQNLDATTILSWETHGTGTALGDPIEMEGLLNTLAHNGSQLSVAALKPNIGHCEVAAGVLQLIKVVTVLEQHTGTGNLHLRQTNAMFDLTAEPLFIPSQIVLPILMRSSGGLCSFGYAGTNACALISLTGSPAHSARELAVVVYREHRLQWWSAVPSSNCEILLGSALLNNPTLCTWQASWQVETINYLRDHRVGTVPVVPGTGYLELARSAGCMGLHMSNLILAEQKFEQFMFLESADLQLEVVVTLNKATQFTSIKSLVSGAWDQNYTTKIRNLSTKSSVGTSVASDCEVAASQFYGFIGNKYLGDFRCDKMLLGKSCMTSCVHLANPRQECSPHLQFCAALDALTHGTLLFTDRMANLQLPFYLDRLGDVEFESLPSSLFTHGVLYGHTSNELIQICLNHNQIGSLHKLQPGFMPPGTLELSRVSKMLYQTKWQSDVLPEAGGTPVAVCLHSVDQYGSISSESNLDLGFHAVSVSCPTSPSTAATVMHAVCSLLSSFDSSHPVWVLTCGCSGPAAFEWLLGGLSSLVRSLSLEQSSIYSCTDTDDLTVALQRPISSGSRAHTAQHGSVCEVMHAVPRVEIAMVPIRFAADETFLITGESH